MASRCGCNLCNVYIVYMWKKSSVFSHESAQRNVAGHLKTFFCISLYIYIHHFAHGPQNIFFSNSLYCATGLHINWRISKQMQRYKWLWVGHFIGCYRGWGNLAKILVSQKSVTANSLTPGRCGTNVKYVIFKHMSMSCPCEYFHHVPVLTNIYAVIWRCSTTLDQYVFS